MIQNKEKNIKNILNFYGFELILQKTPFIHFIDIIIGSYS